MDACYMCLPFANRLSYTVGGRKPVNIVIPGLRSCLLMLCAVTASLWPVDANLAFNPVGDIVAIFMAPTVDDFRSAGESVVDYASNALDGHLKKLEAAGERFLER